MYFFFLKFINIIQQTNYTQHRYNRDHEAKLMIRNKIASIKTGKKENNNKTKFKKGLIYTY